MHEHPPNRKLPGLPLLKRAIAAGDPRRSFIKLLERLLDAGMPRSAIVHENIPGDLPDPPDARARGGTSLSYVSDRRFILTLAGEHRTIREFASRRRDIVVRPGQLCWMPADSWYLVRNGPARTMLSVVFQDDRTRFVWYHNLPLASAAAQPTQILLSHQTGSAPGGELAHALALMHAACPPTAATATATVTVTAATAATAAEPGPEMGPEMEPDSHTLAASARALLAWCLRELRADGDSAGRAPRPPGGCRLVDEISAYVTDHLQGDLSRDHVALVFGISPDHLTRLFRLHAAGGFAGFVTAARLRFAGQLLIKSKLSVKEIGASCGFNSSAYFVKRFREHHGAPPLEWRGVRRGSPVHSVAIK
ncbi:MAG: AraC family transcriptional regulator [Opitutaceae bacterium]|jgi:AraC-like DNA-binding protein|nr:AraC family transcriptional regulator [Opitutaceae bacterium]